MKNESILTKDQLRYLTCEDLSLEEEQSLLEKCTEDFRKKWKEEEVKKEITDYFCEKIKKDTGCENIIDAWKRYKEGRFK